MEPTKTRLKIGSGGLLYLLVTGIILASAIYTQANLLFWGFGLMVGGLVLSVVAAVLVMRSIELTRIVPSHAAAGEALALRYRLHNRGWLPAFAVVLREEWPRAARGEAGVNAVAGGMLAGPPHAWVLHLGPGQTAQTQAPCRPRRRGTLRFERVVVSSSFPFGVLHKTLSFAQQDQVRVFPHLYRIRRHLLPKLTSSRGGGGLTVERAGGSEEFFGVRPYRPGDSPRMIDWKRTARTGDLVARELTMPSPPGLELLLDLRRSDPATPEQADVPPDATGINARQLEERAISLTASLICDAHLHGYRVGLRILGAGGGVFRAMHSLPHRTRLLETLAAIALDGDTDGPSHEGQAGATSRVDVIVWPGTGSAVPRRAGGAGSSATILGAADFDRYVTTPAVLGDLTASARQTRATARRTRQAARAAASSAAPSAFAGAAR